MSSSKHLTAYQDAPKHVAIIMDGNGRWAKERGLPRIDGHIKGADNIVKVLEAASENNVKYLTLYAFSSENWNRPAEEVSALMELLQQSIRRYKDDFIKNKIRFHTIGDISELPSNCIDEINSLKQITKDFDKAHLILALNYGSRDEICRAVKKMSQTMSSEELNEINWEIIAKNLDTVEIPDPDLLIRTSGEMRLSNYLMLQAAYAELYFTKTYWPDFGHDEFVKAIDEFKRRERRYGLTTDQLKNV